jgi:hypothetical protein
MTDTPYFDAYEKYKQSKLKFNISIRKTYITLPSGQKVLQDIDVFDNFGNSMYCMEY